MRRKTLLAILLVVLLLGLIVGGTVALLRHEPAFYSALEIEPGVARVNQSDAFVRELTRLLSDIVNDRENWQATFTQTQLNAYFEEHCIQSGVSKTLLPEGVCSPRLSFGEDRTRLAFRYGTPPWSTIVSLEFRMWMAPKEINVVALELLGLRAGALPLSPQMLLDPVIESARRHNIEVTWYRHNGNPVAVFKFLNNRARPCPQLTQLVVRDESLTIVGCSRDPAAQIQGPARAQTPRGN